MSDEPNLGGRPPEYSDEEYQQWYRLLEPHLELGNSLYYAIKKSGLLGNKNSIYRKYHLKDWFWEKIEDLRREPGELVNEGIVTKIRTIVNKIKRNEDISDQENKLLMFYAERSRSAQPFFVNRQETAPAKPFDEIIAELEGGDTIDDVAETFKQQGMAATAPIQNQE